MNEGKLSLHQGEQGVSRGNCVCVLGERTDLMAINKENCNLHSVGVTSLLSRSAALSSPLLSVAVCCSSSLLVALGGGLTGFPTGFLAGLE